MDASCGDTQKQIVVPKCLGALWDGARKFDVFAALRESNITIQEFDTAWMKKRSSLTSKQAKMQFVRLLKDAGVGGGHAGDIETRRRRKVWFVNELVGRGTGAPAPVVAPANTRTYVSLFVRVSVDV